MVCKGTNAYIDIQSIICTLQILFGTLSHQSSLKRPTLPRCIKINVRNPLGVAYKSWAMYKGLRQRHRFQFGKSDQCLSFTIFYWHAAVVFCTKPLQCDPITKTTKTNIWFNVQTIYIIRGLSKDEKQHTRIIPYPTLYNIQLVYM